jgi:hypothetical protein
MRTPKLASRASYSADFLLSTIPPCRLSKASASLLGGPDGGYIQLCSPPDEVRKLDRNTKLAGMSNSATSSMFIDDS